MADLTVVTNALTLGTTYPPAVGSGTAGAANLTAGQTVCRNSSTGVIEKADTNGASAYMKTIIGICLEDTLAGANVRFISEGSLIFTAILTAGVIYVGSDTAGGIKPAADLSAENTNIVGVAISTTELRVHLFNSGAVHA
jgi:hypothetical protein